MPPMPLFNRRVLVETMIAEFLGRGAIHQVDLDSRGFYSHVCLPTPSLTQQCSDQGRNTSVSSDTRGAGLGSPTLVSSGSVTVSAGAGVFATSSGSAKPASVAPEARGLLSSRMEVVEFSVQRRGWSAWVRWAEWLGQCLEGASTSDSREECDSDRQEVLSDDGEEKVIPVKTKIGSKPHSTPLTLKWLEENYEVAERVCIPRSTLYVHYMDFCEKTDSQPVNAASFGKIIRQQFPHITTRRLGTRGQSKYHYYGVGVRETSIYYDVMFSAKGVDGGIDGKKDGMKQIAAYSPRSKLGTLLPDFPEIQDIKIPSGVDEGKVITFLMMYRTHCQRILDTVIRANFDEVQSFLLHFWQGMPSHMVPILDCETVIMLVGVCDSILYKAVASVLMPTVLQALPESLMQVIRKFARQLDDWLKIALNNLPNGLRKIKFDLARRFGQVLKRQTSLSHLCQTARTVVQSADITAQMLDDWVGVDLNSIGKQTLYTMDQYSERDHKTIFTLCTEFEKLLEDQAPMESYIEWLDSMVDRCVVQPGFRKPGCLRRIARQFLLMWSCFGTRIIRDMTLHSAASFGSFHLLHLMFDDYVLYLVENIHNQERANEYLRLIRGEQTQGDVEEMILPDPSVMKQNLVHSGGEAGLQELPDQSRDSIITSRNNMAQIDYDTNIDVMAPAMHHHQDKLLLDTGRGCHLGSEGQGVASLYQNCASFSSSYPTSQQGDKTLAHLPPVTGSYSMPATQVRCHCLIIR
ncbi:transcription factor RFX4-like [Gigantopelta aegis]|uniref:transcription factor RFX4-like n=1 Tax=Gigantopelta aegis TaxID=1735272 RepID=UPI001B888A7E|nr:transcription factor RFX4-like [Gigantopelta aegis]